jgi:hypothetical protein
MPLVVFDVPCPDPNDWAIAPVGQAKAHPNAASTTKRKACVIGSSPENL